ncbi:MAG: hypothetical protein ACI8TP_005024 [Acidimicrobiales bacterium]|jgi:hypothetical protein
MSDPTPSSVTESATFAVAADKLWELVADFGGIDKIMDGVESVSTEGEGVGMLRIIPAGDTVVVESLDVFDPDARTLTYAIKSGPLPFKDYSATMVVTENDSDSCTLDWTGTFEPAGVPAEKAERLASGIYRGGIAGYQKALGLEA